MTLAIAWRTTEGIVIQADSQQTNGHYRMEVEKIASPSMGRFQTALTGSGNPALIESFFICLQRRINASDTTEISEFRRLVEEELSEFYDNDVRLCTDEDRTMRLLIAASCPEAGTFDAWTTVNIRLMPILGCQLIGWTEALYTKMAQEFYRDSITLAQAALAGLYVMSMAEATSNYVKNPVSMAIVRKGGVFIEHDAYIQKMQDRLREYGQRLNSVFLACADTTVHAYQLNVPARLKTRFFDEGAMARDGPGRCPG